MTWRRRGLFAGAAVCLAVAVSAGLLIATDVYLHHRVQNLGGANVQPVMGLTE